MGENINKNQHSLKEKINWNGLFAYAEWLFNEKDKNNDRKVFRFLNYFLLSPNLLESNNIKYYYDTLSQLSLFYCQANNIHGLDWVYHSFIRTQRTHQRASLDIQAKIFYRYAYLLNSRDVFLSFAYKLLNEITHISDSQLKNDYIQLKYEIENKLRGINNLHSIKVPFERNEFEMEDDYWNPYINENNNGQEDKTTNKNNINIQNEPIQKIKVFILTINHNLPIIPRYIHYKNTKEFKTILSKFGDLNHQKCFVFNENEKETLLYLLFSFLDEKKLLPYKSIDIDNFMSFQITKNYILTFVFNNNKKDASSKIPEGIKPFYDFSTYLLKLKKDNFIWTGTGFPNFGKTCYINAGLQCILHCNKLTKYFLDLKIEPNIMNEVSYSFIKFIKSSNNESLFNLINVITNIKPKFQIDQRNDSPELVSDILSLLGSEACRAKYELHDYSIYPKDSGEMSWEKFLSKESSIITDLFYGQLKHQCICNCGVKVNYEEFLILDIPVQNYLISFPFFKSNQKGDPKENPLRVYYLTKSDLTRKYIVNEIKRNYDIIVDVLILNYNTSEVRLMNDSENVNDFFSSFVETNFEIVLYEKLPYHKRICYLVPFSQFGYSTNFFKNTTPSFQEISGYPIQICKTNDSCKSNGNGKETFIEEFKYFFREKNLDAKDLVFYNGKTLYYFNNNSSFQEYINNSKKDIFYTYSKNKKWVRGPEQLENNNPYLQECFDLLFNTRIKNNCKKCSQIKKMKSVFTILPHYLLIYFKRFYLDKKSGKFCSSKIFVNVPQSFKLNDNKKNTHNYEAFAMINFKDHYLSKHYIAVCKEENKWFKFDDDEPKKSVKFEPTNEVLLIFYEKK